jgi:AraC-like DNA-binding protein
MKESINVRIDPSEVKQLFSPVSLQLHCCRYWKLHIWEFANMSVPFWRLYYNTVPGASVRFKDTEIHLQANSIALIPPRTSFSTKLKSPFYSEITSVRGRRINKHDVIDDFPSKNQIDHLFIHFNAGMPLDIIEPGIYEIKLTPTIESYLLTIRNKIVSDFREFKIDATLTIQKLILELISTIPYNLSGGPKDRRIIESIEFIEQNFRQKLTNELLAKNACMATNSFARLFKQEASNTIQQFIQQTRIEKACVLLHHSNESIDSIAYDSGFCDRFYFTKVFKELTGISPAAYKKHHTMS